jgi:hypothetical protein
MPVNPLGYLIKALGLLASCTLELNKPHESWQSRA